MALGKRTAIVLRDARCPRGKYRSMGVHHILLRCIFSPIRMSCWNAFDRDVTETWSLIVQTLHQPNAPFGFGAAKIVYCCHCTGNHWCSALQRLRSCMASSGLHYHLHRKRPRKHVVAKANLYTVPTFSLLQTESCGRWNTVVHKRVLVDQRVISLLDTCNTLSASHACMHDASYKSTRRFITHGTVHCSGLSARSMSVAYPAAGHRCGCSECVYVRCILYAFGKVYFYQPSKQCRISIELSQQSCIADECVGYNSLSSMQCDFS